MSREGSCVDPDEDHDSHSQRCAKGHSERWAHSRHLLKGPPGSLMILPGEGGDESWVNSQTSGMSYWWLVVNSNNMGEGRVETNHSIYTITSQMSVRYPSGSST